VWVLERTLDSAAALSVPLCSWRGGAAGEEGVEEEEEPLRLVSASITQSIMKEKEEK